MLRLGLGAAAALAVAYASYLGVQWLREDAVRDFVRDAALEAAEARRENTATKDRITKEIDNATIDDLRARAAAGGMFVEDPAN